MAGNADGGAADAETEAVGRQAPSMYAIGTRTESATRIATAAPMRRRHLSMNGGPGPRRQYVADQDRDAAERQMRRVGEHPGHQGQVADTVDQNSKIEITAAGQKAEHAVGEIERAEQ